MLYHFDPTAAVIPQFPQTPDNTHFNNYHTLQGVTGF